jgi:hypothetical protein
VLIAASLAGCGAAQATPTAKATDSATATPTAAPTATPTPVPTPTPTPNIQGHVVFTGKRTDGFSTSVRLYGGSRGFSTDDPVSTGAGGSYSFGNVTPGDYNLWVVLTGNYTMISGCTDVTLPKGWTVAILMGGTTSISIEETSLKAANTWAKGAMSGVTNLYANSPSVKLAQGKTMTLDVKLACK